MFDDIKTGAVINRLKKAGFANIELFITSDLDMEAVWISFAFVLGFLVRPLGLPPLIGYLVAGFVLSAYGFQGGDLLAKLAHAGVLLLLFSVGLKLRLKSLVRPEVWGGAILHMALIGLLIGPVLHWALGLELKLAVLITLALSFSSTVVAAKVLEGKKELRAFHGRVAIGILVVQDIVAVAILATANGHTPSPWALAVLALPLLKYFFQRILELCGHGELLVLYGLMLALVVGGAGFNYIGLSPELGALLMGAMLAGHRRSSELSNALWGLKEIFLVGFFLQIGMSGLPSFDAMRWALILALLLPVKVLLFFLVLVLFRLRARTAFLTGLSLATYSEFGLIVANLAVQNGWMSADWLVMLAVAVAISFVLAAPLNRYAHDLYRMFERRLLVFESPRRHPDDKPLHVGYSNVLIMGMGRVGTGAYRYFTQRKQRVVGLDSDPGKVEEHKRRGRRVLFADAEDPGLWQNIDLSGVRAVLLAIPDREANTIAAKQLRLAGYKGLICATALYPEEVKQIIDAGADVAYYYYDEVGVGFAENIWERLNPSKNNATVKPLGLSEAQGEVMTKGND
jgi:predicted Kef-type K+ transport protein